MNNILKNQKGVILAMTLIVITLLLAVAIGFATLIIPDIQQARTIDNSVVAYYAAEAGIERNLYLLRKKGVTSTAIILSNISSSTLPSNNSRWNTSSSTDYEPVFIRQRLYNGQAVKLYFLNRESNPTSSTHMKIEWDEPAGAGNMILHLAYTQLTPSIDPVTNALVFPSGEKDIISGGTYIEPLPEQGKNYVYEFRALGGMGINDFIEKLKVTACDDPSCTIINDQAISNITLISVGTYQKAVQQIIAQIPPQTPASGILSFVLFSEEDITKGY